MIKDFRLSLRRYLFILKVKCYMVIFRKLSYMYRIASILICYVIGRFLFRICNKFINIPIFIPSKLHRIICLSCSLKGTHNKMITFDHNCEYCSMYISNHDKICITCANTLLSCQRCNSYITNGNDTYELYLKDNDNLVNDMIQNICDGKSVRQMSEIEWSTILEDHILKN